MWEGEIIERLRERPGDFISMQTSPQSQLLNVFLLLFVTTEYDSIFSSHFNSKINNCSKWTLLIKHLIDLGSVSYIRLIK